MPETYQWLLVPKQATPEEPIVWEALRLSTGDESLAARAGKKLKNDELLISDLGVTILRKELDDIPLWRGNHVAVRQLIDDFARYPYLPRVAGPEVLVKAMQEGVALLTWRKDGFAYAESYDEAASRYRGLRGGQSVSITPDSGGLLVKPEVAARQLDAEVPSPPSPGPAPGPAPGPDGEKPGSYPGAGETLPMPPTPPAPPPPHPPRRFYGKVRVDPTRVLRDAKQIADEVITHLIGQKDAEVTVIIEIEAKLPNGASDQLVRTVTENANTLKFESRGFEPE